MAWNYGESGERYPIDTGRLRRVIETATRQAGWGRKLPKGRGLGLAALPGRSCAVHDWAWCQ
jgi:isoquinoline 1-oxidoreductase beta subunit